MPRKHAAYLVNPEYQRQEKDNLPSYKEVEVYHMAKQLALLCYPTDSRKQNIFVAILDTDRKDQLVLNDVVKVTIEAAEAAIKTEGRRLSYSLSSQPTGPRHQNPTEGLAVDGIGISARWSAFLVSPGRRPQKPQLLQQDS